MTIRPIIFSAPMVRALLEGRKTQTRRILKPRPWNAYGDTVNISIAKSAAYVQGADARWYYSFEHPLGGPLTAYVSTFNRGDLLYVREGYFQRGHWEALPNVKTKAGRMKWRFVPADDVVLFGPPAEFREGRHHKDPETIAWHKRLPRFMARRYSRLTLEVTDVRVRRLNEITEEDAMAEGVADTNWYNAAEGAISGGAPWSPGRLAFADLWQTLHGPDSWALNPWVVAVTFTVHRVNVDQFSGVETAGAA